MKKLYSALALTAMAVSFSVSAEVTLPQTIGFSSMKNLELVSDFSEVNLDKASVKKEVAKAPAKISDLTGYWAFHFNNMWSSTSGFDHASLQILPGEKENEVLIYGLILPYPLTGTVDLEKGTISIAEQVVGKGWIDDKTQVDLWLLVYNLEEGADGKLKGPFRTTDPLVLQYYPDGVTDEDGTYYVGWLNAANQLQCAVYSNPTVVESSGEGLSGWGGGFQLLNGPFDSYVASLNLSIVEYNENQWTKCADKASFTDGWMAPVLSETGTLPAYDVEVAVNNSNCYEIMLVNPYGKNTIFEEANTYPGNGAIVLDITDRECVLVKPCVPGGFGITGFYKSIQFFFSNMEGVTYYMDGGSEDPEGMKTYLEDMGYTLSTLDGNVVTINNCVFSNADDILSYTMWTDEDDLPIESVAQIELPQSLLDGVEGITNDVNNGPKRFFNLQGVEVSAPVKGEVVIVKEGNKSYKELAR